MMDNRHGIAIDTLLTEASGRAEREAALALAAHLPGRNKRVTLGADKGYDTLDFVNGLRQYAVTRAFWDPTSATPNVTTGMFPTRPVRMAHRALPPAGAQRM
jgi:hypothetical protein